MFFLSSWQCPSSLLCFSRFFITSSQISSWKCEKIRGDQAGKLGVPLRSSCCSTVILPSSIASTWLRWAVEVLKCDVLVFLLVFFFLRRGLIINFWETNKKKSAEFRGDFFPASRKLAKSFLLKAPRLLQQVNRIWWRLFEMSVFWPGWSNSQMMTTHCQRFRSSFNVVCCRVFLRGVCDVFHSIFGIGCRLVGTSYQQARKLVIAHNKLDINTCMFIQFVLLNV